MAGGWGFGLVCILDLPLKNEGSMVARTWLVGYGFRMMGLRLYLDSVLLLCSTCIVVPGHRACQKQT